jgi:hypothetical protein
LVLSIRQWPTTHPEPRYRHTTLLFYTHTPASHTANWTMWRENQSQMFAQLFWIKAVGLVVRLRVEPDEIWTVHPPGPVPQQGELLSLQISPSVLRFQSKANTVKVYTLS